MPSIKLSKPSGLWGSGQNLSVHLDAKKRIVMEKIQIELTTVKTNHTQSCEYEFFLNITTQQCYSFQIRNLHQMSQNFNSIYSY